MKVNLESMLGKIKGITYTLLPDNKTTICQLTLENNYTVNGHSACVDITNYNKDLGEKYAYEDAVKQLWPLEGYLLAENIWKTK